MKFTIPEIIVGRAKAAGEVGEKWLRDLPEIVGSLERDWEIEIDDILHGGSHALVARAHDHMGKSYVLKVEVPDAEEDAFIHSLSALDLAAGKGYVMVFKSCTKRRAWLLEPMGSTLKKSTLTPREQMEIICNALKETWETKIPEGTPLNQGSTQWFREYITGAWEELHHPCHEKVVAKAIEYVERLAANTQPENYVLVHGDAHNNNMLEALDGSGYKLIDPDGMIFEKSYDLGVLMREWPEEFEEDSLESGKVRAEFLSKITGVPARDIWEWGFLQMTATGLILLQIKDTDLGTKMLSIAEKWC